MVKSMYLNEDSIRGSVRQEELLLGGKSPYQYSYRFVDIAYIGGYTFYSEDNLDILEFLQILK
jgi:hypothetical protein